MTDNHHPEQKSEMPVPEKESVIRDIRASNRERLGEAIRAAQVEIDKRIAQGARDDEHTGKRADNTEAPWVAPAQDHLNRSIQLFTVGQFDAGWTAVSAALRETVGSYNETELRTEAERLRVEAEDKLDRWRAKFVNATTSAVTTLRSPHDLRSQLEDLLKNHSADDTHHAEPGDGQLSLARYNDLMRSIRDLVATTKPWSPEETDDVRVYVTETRRVLDDHADNGHRKRRLLRFQLLWGAIALVAVLAIVALLVLFEIRLEGAQEIFSEAQQFLLVMALGALGASLSGLLNLLATDKSRRVPDIKAQRNLVWLRPVIGAAAAIVSVGALAALGLVGNPDGGNPASVAFSLYAIAFVAGFSEQFVTRAVATASGALQN